MDATIITEPLTTKNAPLLLAAPDADPLAGESLSTKPVAPAVVKATPWQIVLMVLGTIAFLYFARPVILPIFLAGVGAMTLKPLIRWLSYYRIPPALSAAVVLCVLVSVSGVGFFQLGRPAVRWMNEAPQHLIELKQRVQIIFPRLTHFSRMAAAVTNPGATTTENPGATTIENPPVTTVEVKDNRGTNSLVNWTGNLLEGAGETLVLIYLLLASGDMLFHKLINVMPTLHDKKTAIAISHEIRINISNYLFFISLTNLGVGLLVFVGLYFMGVPNAAMWGMFAAVLNYVPYFGPIVGVILLATVGLLTFDTVWRGILPPAWYLMLHLLEANLITPVLLGGRFTLNPVFIFISLIFWTWLWGIPGALLSVPIMVSVKVVCDRIPALSPVSELLKN